MKRLSIFLKLALLGGVTIASSKYAVAADKKESDKVFYRYKNEQGVKVVAQTIPPKYVPAGYEIVSVNGQVLKTVAASPAAADAERVAKERKAAQEQARADIQLRRTYSTVGEIEGAKNRNLVELRNNINILQANLVSVKSQLKDQETHAAAMERSGKKVSDDILKNITTLRTEEKDVTAQIKQRELEYETSADKYEQDKKRFVEITAPKPTPLPQPAPK